MNNWKARIAGVLMVLLSIRYIIWVAGSLNQNALYLSIPFLCVSVYLVALLFVTFINNWSSEKIEAKKVDKYEEKQVWTIIPTCGEPVEILEKTVESWIEQDYPIFARNLIVSSQTKGDAVKIMTVRLNRVALRLQAKQFEKRYEEISNLVLDLNTACENLDKLYLELSTLSADYDDEGRETTLYSSLKHDLATEIDQIETWLFDILGLKNKSILSGDNELAESHLPRMEMIWQEVRTLEEKLVFEFNQTVKAKKDGDKWLPVIYYHEPHISTNSKALNLNSALSFMYDKLGANPMFLETRDADDLAPEDFLSLAIGTLEINPNAAFLQSKKLTMGSSDFPLENDEPVFFDRIMPSKNASRSVFPCGSGLVWRTEDLAQIGQFPNWNLVEDLYSGFLAWQMGKYGVYLDVVGAVGQVAPEDIPNIYKQRGTWALDTMRLFFWHSKKGLSLRQRLQFLEIGMFYLLSFPIMFLVLVPIISLLFGVHPLVTDHLQYALHFWPFAASIEIFLIVMADGIPYGRIWRSRQTWFGLAPVYAKACILALFNGPDKKPAYKVTRKHHEFAFYWKQTAIQWSIAGLSVFAIAYHVLNRSVMAEADLGSIFYTVFYLFYMSGILKMSWFGLFRKKEA